MKKSMENYSSKMQPLFEKLGQLTMLQRLLIGIVVFALLLGCFVFFSIKPKYEQISNVEKQISETNKKVAVAKKKAAELPQWKEKWAKKQEEFEVVMHALPDKQEIPRLLSEISAAGRNSGLIFNRFAPQGEITRDFYAEIPVGIAITGTYDRLKLFFTKVAEMPRVVNIKNTKMSMKKGGEISTKCTAVTYRFLTEKEKKAQAKKKKGKKGRRKRKKR